MDMKAQFEFNWIPSKEDLTIEMNPLPNGGSCIFNELRGYIPVLEGELEFVWLENVGKIGVLSDGGFNEWRKNRRQLYQLSVEKIVQWIEFILMKAKLIHHRLKRLLIKNIELTDQNNISVLASVLDIIGKSVLIDWWKKS